MCGKKGGCAFGGGRARDGSGAAFSPFSSSSFGAICRLDATRRPTAILFPGKRQVQAALFSESARA